LIHTKKMASQEQKQETQDKETQKEGEQPLDIEYLAKTSEGYTGAEISQICNEAAFFALRRNINANFVTHNDFLMAFKKVRPRLTQQQINFYKNYYSSTTGNNSNNSGFSFNL